MPRQTAIACAALTALCAVCVSARGEPVDFNRDIRPILSGTCFKCHGPDDGARKAGLRLDLRDGAIKTLKDGKTAIVAGDAAASELIRRVTTDDEDDLMPPPKAGPHLTPRQVAKSTNPIVPDILVTGADGAGGAMSAGVMGFLREFQRQHSAPPRP